MAHSLSNAITTNYHDITELDELKYILLMSDRKCVVRFYRPGCPACDASAGRWLELSRRPESGACNFVNVDVTEAKELTKLMHVEMVPTYILLKKGSESRTVVNSDMLTLKLFIEVEK